MKIGALALTVALFALPRVASAESSAIILTGLGADAKHTAKFTKWTDETRKVLVERFAFSPDHVIVVADKESTQENIKKAFEKAKTQLKATDTFFLIFIGHGAPWEIPGTLPEVNLAALDQAQQRGGGGRGGPGGGGGRGGGGRGGGGRGGGPQTPQGKMDYKFNSQGADFTGTEYAQMLPNVARVIIINSTNSSGASLETMAGKNRVVITATRSATEANDTVFYEHFLAALQDSAADEDKDKKVSVWETFKFASDAVDRFYKEQGRLATEHPMLSDNGGEAVNTTVKDPPVLSRYTVFNVDRPLTATDARLQTLLEQRREIEIKIQELKLREGIMAAPDFQKEMQERLLELAQKTAEINALTRQQEKK